MKTKNKERKWERGT